MTLVLKHLSMHEWAARLYKIRFLKVFLSPHSSPPHMSQVFVAISENVLVSL